MRRVSIWLGTHQYLSLLVSYRGRIVSRTSDRHLCLPSSFSWKQCPETRYLRMCFSVSWERDWNMEGCTGFIWSVGRVSVEFSIKDGFSSHLGLWTIRRTRNGVSGVFSQRNTRQVSYKSEPWGNPTKSSLLRPSSFMVRFKIGLIKSLYNILISLSLSLLPSTENFVISDRPHHHLRNISKELGKSFYRSTDPLPRDPFDRTGTRRDRFWELNYHTLQFLTM